MEEDNKTVGECRDATLYNVEIKLRGTTDKIDDFLRGMNQMKHSLHGVEVEHEL